eukprot:scaffold105325_cov31-Tisochrysis_lutea.AAC.1
MASVMAVKTQLSSPAGERRSLGEPGRPLAIRNGAPDGDRPGAHGYTTGCGAFERARRAHPRPRTSPSPEANWSATRIGEVRQAVKRSAGSSGLVGSSSSAPHAHSKITWGGGMGNGER